MRGQDFLEEVRTLPHFRMFSLGSYPGLVQVEDNTGLEIEGEVWEVDASCLADLDVIEAVHEGEYVREAIPLHAPFSDVHVECYLYLGDVSGLGEVGSRW